MRGIAVYDFTWLKNDHHQTHNKKKHDCISLTKDENNRPCASSRSKAPNRTSGEFSLLCNERHRRMALDSIILHFRLISWQIPFISLPSINIKGEQSIYWSNHGYNSFIRLLRTIIAMVCSNLLQRRTLCSQFPRSFISSPTIPFVLWTIFPSNLLFILLIYRINNPFSQDYQLIYNACLFVCFSCSLVSLRSLLARYSVRSILLLFHHKAHNQTQRALPSLSWSRTLLSNPWYLQMLWLDEKCISHSLCWCLDYCWWPIERVIC